MENIWKSLTPTKRSMISIIISSGRRNRRSSGKKHRKKLIWKMPERMKSLRRRIRQKRKAS